MRLVKRIKSMFNLWYMDDGTLGGHIDVLISDWKMLVEEGKKIGLVVNVAKYELITDDVEVIDKFRVVAQEIKVVSSARRSVANRASTTCWSSNCRSYDFQTV